MAKIKMTKARFRVGDQVHVPFGARKVRATILEDRGPVGAGGRQIYRVELPMLYSEPLSVEVPEVEIEAIKPGRTRSNGKSSHKAVGKHVRSRIE